MSDCHPEALEGYAAGTLDKAEATAVVKHLSACAACAEELRWLEREQRLFAARAKAHPAPAPFEAVLAALGEDAAPVAEAVAARTVEAVPARMADSRAPPSVKTGTK